MPKQRSLPQNNSLHKFCKDLSDELNSKGITQGQFSVALETDNTPESVKDAFRQMGFRKYLAKSTADLTTTEMSDIYEEIKRVIAFHPEWNLKNVEWPSSDPQNY